MSTQRTPRSDKELWQSLAAAPRVASAPLTDLDFAAWLDGRLAEPEAARIEAAVAADPTLRRAALDLADLLGKPLPATPERLVVRARSLVGFEAERRGAGGWLSRLAPSGLRRAVQRAAMAMAALVIASGGFVVGGGLGASFAQERYGTNTSTTATTSAGTSNEMSEFFASDGI